MCRARVSAERGEADAAAFNPAHTVWQPVQDPETGHMYYHNAETGATSWTKPGALA